MVYTSLHDAWIQPLVEIVQDIEASYNENLT